MTVRDDYFLVVAKGTALGEPWQNRWWFYVDAVGTTLNIPAAVVAGVYNEFYNVVFAHMADTTTLDEITAANWKNPAEFAATTYTRIGDKTTDPLPGWLTYNVRFNRAGTGFNYPQKRLPAGVEADTDGNTIDNAVVSAITAAATNVCILNFLGGAVLYHVTFGIQPPFGQSAPQSMPGQTYQVVSGGLGVKLGTQKTRKP